MSATTPTTTTVKPTTKRNYTKKPLVIKKFLTKEENNGLIKMTKTFHKNYLKSNKEFQKQQAKDAKNAAKAEKEAEKEAEKQKIKDAKEAAKTEKKAEKELEKQALKDAKTEEKEKKKAEKKAEKNKKTQSSGNILDVIQFEAPSTNNSKPTNLVIEARDETTQELSEEIFITTDEITGLANALAPGEVKKKTRGRPKKSKLDLIAPNSTSEVIN